MKKSRKMTMATATSVRASSLKIYLV